MRDLGCQDQFYLLVTLIKNIAYMVFSLSDRESTGDEGYRDIRETERKADGETEGRRRNTGRLSSGDVNENLAK